jgi:hypothetical protein
MEGGLDLNFQLDKIKITSTMEYSISTVGHTQYSKHTLRGTTDSFILSFIHF